MHNIWGPVCTTVAINILQMSPRFPRVVLYNDGRPPRSAAILPQICTHRSPHMQLPHINLVLCVQSANRSAETNWKWTLRLKLSIRQEDNCERYSKLRKNEATSTSSGKSKFGHLHFILAGSRVIFDTRRITSGVDPAQFYCCTCEFLTGFFWGRHLCSSPHAINSRAVCTPSAG